MGDLVEAEAGFSSYGAVSGRSNLGRATGGGNHKVVAHKVQLIFLSGVLYVHLHLVPVVDLFLNVFINL